MKVWKYFKYIIVATILFIIFIFLIRNFTTLEKSEQVSDVKNQNYIESGLTISKANLANLLNCYPWIDELESKAEIPRDINQYELYGETYYMGVISKPYDIKYASGVCIAKGDESILLPQEEENGFNQYNLPFELISFNKNEEKYEIIYEYNGHVSHNNYFLSKAIFDFSGNIYFKTQQTYIMFLQELVVVG